MTGGFPGSPRLLKGALVGFETPAPVPTSIVAFQYNPDTVTRAIAPGTSPDGDPPPRTGSGDTLAVLPPSETFTLTVELDAADHLETPGEHPLTVATGVHPTLAALELLMYPHSSQMLLRRSLTLGGSAVVTPARAPLVLLVWGALRVVPVRVTSVSITEQAFDPVLNPIRAQVELELRSLTEAELVRAGPPFNALGVVNHVAKEVLARTNVVNAAEQIRGMLPL